ncbi:MAG: hypothetical protein WB290_03195, partial [Smithella sp.]
MRYIQLGALSFAVEFIYSCAINWHFSRPHQVYLLSRDWIYLTSPSFLIRTLQTYLVCNIREVFDLAQIEIEKKAEHGPE